MSDGQLNQLVRMANQIAANMAHLDEEAAAAELARHLKRFWAPSMRQQLCDYAAGNGAGLAPAVRLAVAQI